MTVHEPSTGLWNIRYDASRNRVTWRRTVVVTGGGRHVMNAGCMTGRDVSSRFCRWHPIELTYDRARKVGEPR